LNDLTTFLILALATWRIAVMAAEEDGPFGLLERIRVLLGVRFDEVGDEYGKNELARNLLCIWCSTPWWGLLWTAFWLIRPGVAVACALPFALSAVAMILHGRGIRFRKKVNWEPGSRL